MNFTNPTNLIDHVSLIDETLRRFVCEQAPAFLDSLPDLPEVLSTPLAERPRVEVQASCPQDIIPFLSRGDEGAVLDITVTRSGYSPQLVLANPYSDGIVHAQGLLTAFRDESGQWNADVASTSCSCGEPECSHVRNVNSPDLPNPNFLATFARALYLYDPAAYYASFCAPIPLEEAERNPSLVWLAFATRQEVIVSSQYDTATIKQSGTSAVIRSERFAFAKSVRDILTPVFAEHGVNLDAFWGDNLANSLNPLWSDRESLKILLGTGDFAPAKSIPLPVQGNVMGGWDGGFGFEIEFTRTPGHDANATVREVDSALRDILGARYNPGMGKYHYSSSYTKWKLENDSSVLGEIVTPILHDTPETWKALGDVYAALRAIPGVSMGKNAGLHTNIGVNKTNMEFLANVAILVSLFQDSMWRVHASPERKEHRNNGYCLAMSNTKQLVEDLRQGYIPYENYPIVDFTKKGRLEFRGPDAAFSLEHAQAQLALAAGIVRKAQTLADERVDLPILTQNVGANETRRYFMEHEGVPLEDIQAASDLDALIMCAALFDWDEGAALVSHSLELTPWQTTRR